MKKCPYCAEEIQDEAKKCKHCGEWLENKNKGSVLSIAKGFLEKSSDYIKERREKQKEDRYKHLFIPSNDIPFELNGTLFYSDYFNHNNRKYLYSDIKSIRYMSKRETINGIFTETENELFLYFPEHCINLSRSSFWGIGAQKKTREKIDFIQSYLKKQTYKSRLNIYLQAIMNKGYFNYDKYYKIYNNGNIEEKGRIIENIYKAHQDNRLNYGDYIASSFTGRNQFYDPYTVYIWHSKDSSKMLLFSKCLYISVYYDKDVFDSMLNKLLNDGEIIEAINVNNK